MARLETWTARLKRFQEKWNRFSGSKTRPGKNLEPLSVSQKSDNALRRTNTKSDFQPANVSPGRRRQRSFTIRLWVVRNARFFEWFYEKFANAFLFLHPLWKAIGYNRAEKPVTFIERQVKGLLFDCRMCGQCVLSSTGMSCPMNCPKQLRNGHCGGVRANGNCEVEPDMPCVWVQAWNGASSMVNGPVKIMNVQKPVDQSLRETSAWLRVTAEAAQMTESTKP